MPRITIEGEKKSLKYSEYLQHKLVQTAEKLHIDSLDELINDFLKIRIFVDEEKLKMGAVGKEVKVRVGEILIIEDLLMNEVTNGPFFQKNVRILGGNLERMEPIIGKLPGRENVTQYARSAIVFGLKIVELMDQQTVPNRELGFVIKINDKETIFI